MSIRDIMNIEKKKLTTYVFVLEKNNNEKQYLCFKINKIDSESNEEIMLQITDVSP